MTQIVCLSSAERILLERATNGQVVEFPTSSARPILRAVVLRQYLLGLPELHALRGISSPALTGLRVHWARIEGPLDLAFSARPSIGLPTVELIDCEIPEEIDISHARIASLSIRGSYFRHLNAREAEIDGPFDFSGVAPCPVGNGSPSYAWIDARGSLVDGQLTGRGARLRAPEPRERLQPRERRAALWLENAEIRGSIILLKHSEPLHRRFRADGGVNLNSALVRGDVLMNGAKVTAGEGDPFQMQGTRIGGSVIGERMKVHGMIWMVAAHINGAFQLSEAKIIGRSHPGCEEAERHGTADKKAAANLGLYLNDEPACRGNQAPGRNRIAINARNAEIGAIVPLNGLRAYGKLIFTSAMIRGDLLCVGAKLVNRTKAGDALAFEAINSEVTRGANFNHACVEGGIDMTGSKIDGDLSFEASRLCNGTWTGEAGHALIARRLCVQGSVQLYGGFRCYGQMDFAGANVGQDFEVGWMLGRRQPNPDAAGGSRRRDATIVNRRWSAIYAKDLTVGDDLRFHRAVIIGDLRFERAEVGGSVLWNDLRIGRYRGYKYHRAKDRPPLDFRHAKIGSALKPQSLWYMNSSRIDLTGCCVGTMEFASDEGWGKQWPKGPDEVAFKRTGWRKRPSLDTFLEVNLDGLTYDRIALSEIRNCTTAPGPVSKARVALRRALRRRANITPLIRRVPSNKVADCLTDLLFWDQSFVRRASGSTGDTASFFPQPFRQLASVLRAQGEEDAARSVAIAEQWATPKSGLLGRLSQALFGFFFGFGLSPRRAFVTFVLWLALGTFGVWAAAREQLLVQSVTISADAVTPRDGRLVYALAQGEPDRMETAQEVYCTQAATNVGADIVFALDLIVPFIPLHQETKCEIEPSDNVFSSAAAWNVARALYCVTGWIVVSLTLLTASGVLKRTEREPE